MNYGKYGPSTAKTYAECLSDSLKTATEKKQIHESKLGLLHHIFIAWAMQKPYISVTVSAEVCLGGCF